MNRRGDITVLACLAIAVVTGLLGTVFGNFRDRSNDVRIDVRGTNVTVLVWQVAAPTGGGTLTAEGVPLK